MIYIFKTFQYSFFFNRLKLWFYPCPIASNILPVIDYELKFV